MNGSHIIRKHQKTTGERLAVWEGPEDGPSLRVDPGFIFQGRLYGVYSNYAGVLMLSGSAEIFRSPARFAPGGLTGL